MRRQRLRAGLVLAAVTAASVLALATDATAQFWGWNRGGWGDGGGGGWGSRFRDDATHDRGFFGDWRRQRESGENGERAPRTPTGTSGYYCVRLCDGYYFPLARAGGFSEAKTLCAGLCPATATDAYSGRTDAMGEARAQNGKAYASLANAFAYRKSLKPECGCSSAEARPMTVANDPTLRAGDIVVTEQGARVFQGSSSRLPHQASAFVDYRNSRSVTGGARTQLDAMVKRYYTTRAQAVPAKKSQGAEKKAQEAEEPPKRGRRGRR